MYRDSWTPYTPLRAVQDEVILTKKGLKNEHKETTNDGRLPKEP